MIVMALALRPDILIADEPTTALDVRIQAQILALLDELQEENGMGPLLITHDLGVVAQVADRVVAMNAGEIVETGTACGVYHNPHHPYTKKLIAAIPGEGEMAAPLGDRIAPILEISGLTRHHGAFVALDEVSLIVFPGESVAIVGGSESGKFTLAKIILWLEETTGGQALFQGPYLIGTNPRALFKVRRDIQMVFQDSTQSLNPGKSIYDVISEALVIHPEILEKQHWKTRVSELLERVGLTAEHIHRHPHQFSGG